MKTMHYVNNVYRKYSCVRLVECVVKWKGWSEEVMTSQNKILENLEFFEIV